MIKGLISIGSAMLAAATLATASTPVTTTETNVLQNISLTLTIYQQGATNANGKSVADKVSSFTTKDLIAALGAATDQQFGSGAKLVQSTVYSNITITTGPGVYSNYFSTNLALANNSSVKVGGINFYGIYGDSGVVVISNNVFITNGFGMLTNTALIVVDNGTNLSTNSINTNAGFITTITPSTNNSGVVTNAAVVTQKQISAPPTESILTNVSSSIDILYGGRANAMYVVTNYLSFSANSAEIVVETGSGLNTTNALTVSNLASQTGFSLQGLQIGFVGATNLTLTLQGFVKQNLKVDVMSSRNPKVVEDIFGASSTWNVIGSGYIGGIATTNLTSMPVQPLSAGEYLTNASPVVVEGSINIGFLGNLAQ